MTNAGMRAKKKKDFLTSLVPIKPVEKIATVEESSSSLVDKDSDEFASVVFPWLLLGGARDAERVDLMERHQVTHVVNLTPESKMQKAEGFCYLFVEVGDHSDQPIHDHFESVIQFIEEARSRQGKVLVHCRHGVSRSATLVIAYLIKQLCIPLVLAKDVVKQARPMINPNLGFVDALINYQATLGIDVARPLSTYRSTLEQWSLSSLLLDSYGGRTGTTSPDSTTPLTSPPSPQGILCF
eukprot:TRINITY_DN31893_c0_g1_i1.p1 TRINITY_DN31893_c0_g1~~TRINITY_DN31893_c0_g1_i1.p1  ORF type:complete len:240 (+),score=77.88 TRINITY_DN31893_c0_g1_i1:184-903(+)